MKIYIDIETIPTQNSDFQAYVCENLKPPANYKNQETIDKWLEENKGEAIHKTALDGAFGEIVVIGVAINDEPPVLFYREDWQSTAESQVHEPVASWLSRFGVILPTFVCPLEFQVALTLGAHFLG